MEEPSEIYVNPFKIYMVKAAGNLQNMSTESPDSC